MGDVALVIPLAAFPIARRGQGRDTSDPRVEVFGDPFDGTALARSVAALEDDHQTRPGMPHPLLQLHEFCLQPE